MKKTLIALAVLGAAAGVAHAQSNVTIYGVVDTGYIKQNGSDVKMGENVNSRIGFKGSEDLGNGLKAIFQLEKRFNVNDGTNNSSAGKDWEGAANVGLASADWGKVRFGRVNELTTETIRKFDPFYQYGVGGMIESGQRNARIDNTVRYDSPKWEGLSVGLSYSLGNDTESKWYDDGGKNYSNDGYGINLSYDNGPWMATANWSRVADSADSDVWNIGVAYKWDNVRVMALYEKTDNNGYKQGGNSVYLDNGDDITAPTKAVYEQDVWLLGMEWDVGPGQVDASVQYAEYDPEVGKDGDVMKYSVGYTYNLSKRTSVYAQVAYTDADKEVAKSKMYYQDLSGESNTAVQIGMTHKF